MMPQLQTDETKNDAVEPAVFEAQADTVELDASNEQPAEVEEIRTEEMSTEKTKPQKRAPEKQEDPSPLLLDPYQFDRCTRPKPILEITKQMEDNKDDHKKYG